MVTPRVDILLATYNGERFLSQQIESILQQTYSNFRLIIRDDGSKDGTLQIIHDFIKKDPKRILLIPTRETLGAKSNFSKLMEYSSAPYVMFSDQDDVWMPHKVELTLQHMLDLEKKHGLHPFLVHSDLVVVNENLKEIHSSFWRYANINPHKALTVNRLLSQNVVTGCTMMVNHLMVDLARPIPPEAFMHDWWIALTAAAFGKIAIVEEPTMYYRQHAKNALGAQKFGSWKNLKVNFQKLLNNNVRKFQQAATFYHTYHALFDSHHRELTRSFLNLQRGSWIQKRRLILKYGFYKQGLLRNVADLLFG